MIIEKFLFTYRLIFCYYVQMSPISLSLYRELHNDMKDYCICLTHQSFISAHYTEVMPIEFVPVSTQR